MRSLLRILTILVFGALGPMSARALDSCGQDKTRKGICDTRFGYLYWARSQPPFRLLEVTGQAVDRYHLCDGPRCRNRQVRLPDAIQGRLNDLTEGRVIEGTCTVCFFKPYDEEFAGKHVPMCLDEGRNLKIIPREKAVRQLPP